MSWVRMKIAFVWIFEIRIEFPPHESEISKLLLEKPKKGHNTEKEKPKVKENRC
jgi:hypothetical protein